MNRCEKNCLDIKRQLQRKYKLRSYERALNLLKRNVCITEIAQVVS